jgi:toxin YoeB
MKLLWTAPAWAEYVEWIDEDLGAVHKINQLLRDIQRSPFRGIGKPEPLKENRQGWWSRRITGEHRLIYRVAFRGEGQVVEIAACRWHYGR